MVPRDKENKIGFHDWVKMQDRGSLLGFLRLVAGVCLTGVRDMTEGSLRIFNIVGELLLDINDVLFLAYTVSMAGTCRMHVMGV